MSYPLLFDQLVHVLSPPGFISPAWTLPLNQPALVSVNSNHKTPVLVQAAIIKYCRWGEGLLISHLLLIVLGVMARTGYGGPSLLACR